jgi:CRISPR-associated endonuclease/helicase Cas3
VTDFPSFDAFFEAIHGYPPFRWQTRLAAQVLAEGWPDLLDLPTGVGKTSALDIALYALARAPHRFPRRTLLVVDRRIVVDQGAEHARKISKCLRKARPDSPAYAIADALRALWQGPPDEAPFAVAVLRGGMPRDNDWAKRPDQPVLGVSTVDQVGSRMFFRGYGIGEMSRSIHAGLMVNDTLILLDEVHLSVPFADTLDAVRDRFVRSAPGLPARFGVVRMSATAPDSRTRGRETKRFDLNDHDREDAILAPRLRSSKVAKLEPLKLKSGDELQRRKQLARRACEYALAHQARGARAVALVFNRVDTARAACALLRQDAQHDADVMLLTGRMRPIERDHVVRTNLPRVETGRSRSEAARNLFVVATQCIEAGADLDFDALVTECASLDALRQRFGRLDRRGELSTSEATIIGRLDQVADGSSDPVYGTALASTWTWLGAVAKEDRVDFGIQALPPAVDEAGAPLKSVLADVGQAPVLMPIHLDMWCQTSPAPSTDPDVELWLHGPDRQNADIQIVWRADIHIGLEKEDCIERLSACRPSSLEAISVPIGAARAWLRGAVIPISDAVGASEEEPEGESKPTASGVFRWRGDNSKSGWLMIGAESEPKQGRLTPGDVIVVPAVLGGIRDGTFDPESTSAVADLGDLAQLRGRGIASLRLTPDALLVWTIGSELQASMPKPEETESGAEARERIRDWFADWPSEPSPDFMGAPNEWTVAVGAFRSGKWHLEIGDYFVVSSKLPKAATSGALEIEDAVSEDDDSSFRAGEISLKRHSRDVQQVATRFAKAIGFSEAIASDLALAAWLHDVGKADPRFQRWLRGGIEARPNTELLAKGINEGNRDARELARKRAGYPKGCRHELLSLAMVSASSVLASANDRDLVMHLVASHHGWCRPFPPFLEDPEGHEVRLAHGDVELGASTRHRLAKLDSGISDRFWSLVDRYGWWGLAWLEAVLRLADHRASEARQAEDAT